MKRNGNATLQLRGCWSLVERHVERQVERRFQTALATRVNLKRMFRLALAALAVSHLAFGAELRSVGALAFGPHGTLFIADSVGGAVFAIETGDTTPSPAASPVELKGIDRKIAAVLGVEPNQILIDDVKVNPISKNIYISVSRGRGLEAIPVILRMDSTGKLTEFSLSNVPYSVARLPNPPVSIPRADYRNPRLETITQLAWVNGKVIVAGLSNEEFSSNLRVIPFPFRSVDDGASVEIYHGSHGEYETQAPVRTFLPYTINKREYIVAAYTCTPLVIIPLKELKAGTKVTGTTIAELGMGNRPLDMIAYRKDNHDFILLANSYRGVLKLPAENLDRYTPITEPEQIAGVPFKRVPALRGVRHLTTLDDANALILADGEDGSLDLRSVPLP